MKKIINKGIWSPNIINVTQNPQFLNLLAKLKTWWKHFITPKFESTNEFLIILKKIGGFSSIITFCFTWHWHLTLIVSISILI